jgi:hypothetical protein
MPHDLAESADSYSHLPLAQHYKWVFYTWLLRKRLSMRREGLKISLMLVVLGGIVLGMLACTNSSTGQNESEFFL